MAENEISIGNEKVALAGPTGNADLTCTCDLSKKWCEHRIEALKTRADARLLWPEPQIGAFAVNVPIFPSQGFFALLDFNPENERYQIVWTQCPTRDNPVICYLNPGEGFQVLRLVIVEYMFGDSDRRKECESFGHGLVAEKAWKKNMKHQMLHIVEKWSVYTTGWCLHCRGKAGDIDDLIPDKNGSIFS